MKKILVIASICLTSALFAGAGAAKLDIQAATQLIDANYAPVDFKKAHLGWELEAQSAAALKKIDSSKSLTVDGSQKIFAGFINSMQDWHVSTFFYSSEISFFPLSVQSAEGHYIFDKVMSMEIDHSFAVFWELFGLDKSSMPTNSQMLNLEKIQIGDELIAFNDVPMSKVVDDLRQKNVGPNQSPTAYRIAEKYLFFRSGMRGHECPKGKFSITVLHQGDKKTKRYEFNWLHIPNVVKNNLAKGIFKENEMKSLFDVEKKFGRRLEVDVAKEALRPFRQIKKVLFDQDDDQDEDDDFDDRKGFLPPLGQIEWTADDDVDPYQRLFWSYIYTNANGKKVGYIHIPNFSPGDAEDIIDYLRSFKENLKILEEKTDIVVLDITNNPGGNAVYMYSMLSMLSNKTLSIPKHYEKLTQKDIFNAHIYLKAMELYPEEFADDGEINDSSHIYDNKKLKAWLQTQVKAWDSGKRLTPLQSLLGITNITPNPTFSLTRPLVVLVNEMDFSCGDFFPAILQDNKRAVIFGKTTAGAGGAVQFFPLSSATGVKGISLTCTLAMRPNGQPIENKGVTPDVPYEPTVRDLRENWVDYIEAVNKTIDSLLN